MSRFLSVSLCLPAPCTAARVPAAPPAPAAAAAAAPGAEASPVLSGPLPRSLLSTFITRRLGFFHVFFSLFGAASDGNGGYVRCYHFQCTVVCLFFFNFQYRISVFLMFIACLQILN